MNNIANKIANKIVTPSEKKYLDWDGFVERMRSIKLLACDVDGVLTDDTIFFGPEKLELKQFNVSDGFYIVLAMRAGLEFVVVSGRHSEATTSRMRDLGVKHVMQAPINKAKLLEPVIAELGIKFEEVAFIGNEILDLPLARRAGLPIGVLDSSVLYINEVDYITSAPGGHGAVKEVIEAYFVANNIDPELLQRQGAKEKTQTSGN